MDKNSQIDIVNSLKKITEESELGYDVNVSVNVSKNRKPMPPNIMVFQAFAYLSATKLKPASNKVLMLFFSLSGYENYIGMDVITIQEQLGLGKVTVINSLKELESNNIIIKTVNITDKRRNDYYINPLSAWKGNNFSRIKAVNKHNEIDPNQLKMFDGAIANDSDLKGNKKATNWPKISPPKSLHQL